MKFQYLFFVVLIGFISCNSKPKQSIENSDSSYFEYAQFIDLKETDKEILVKSAGQETVFSSQELPIQKVMVIPTSAIAYLDLLGVLDKITGISQPDFIYNAAIQSQIEQKKIEVIGTFDEIFVERILLNKPDLLISTSSPTLAKFHTQLANEGIKIIYLDEYNELIPLAKAEYIKLFGVLFGKEQDAEELFQEIKSNYFVIESQMNQLNQKKPTVLVNQMYGDIWYMPCRESFQAKFIADAGGDYLWKDLPGIGSKNLNFEQVFERANEADLWINAGDFPNLQSLLASYKNYEWLKPVQNKKVYNWYKRTTPKGANDYFETGTARPDIVLKDLAAMFYPGLFPDYDLFFYKELE